jgi:hypothetical protein
VFSKPSVPPGACQILHKKKAPSYELLRRYSKNCIPQEFRWMFQLAQLLSCSKNCIIQLELFQSVVFTWPPAYHLLAHRQEIARLYMIVSRSAWRHIVLLTFRVCDDTSVLNHWHRTCFFFSVNTGELFIHHKNEEKNTL